MRGADAGSHRPHEERGAGGQPAGRAQPGSCDRLFASEVADGWIVVACAKEKFWQRLAAAIGRPELAQDARFRDFAARREHAGELREILGEVFKSAPAAAWLDRLRVAGVPCAPINTVEQALADPQTEARDMVAEVDPRSGAPGRRISRHQSESLI